VVSFVSQNTAPSFNVSSYTATLREDTPVGTFVTRVVATPGSVAGPLTYDWVIANSRFTLNASSGVITLAQPLDFFAAPNYLLQVRARDSTNQFSIVDVRVTVTYVAKPPKDIILSTSSVNEGQGVGAVVAQLSSVDPGSSNFTYVISPSNVPFAVSGNTIVTTADLDYHSGPHSYTFNVTTTDETGLSFTKTITVTVVDVIVPPRNVMVCPLTGCGTPFTVDDDKQVQEAIGVINYTLVDNVPITCTVYPNATFFVTSENGVFTVRLRQMLDYRVASSVFVFPSCSVVNGQGVTLVSQASQQTITVVAKPKAPQTVQLTLAPTVENIFGVP